MAVIEFQRRRNPEATRNSILDAAERLFVDKGFAATSMTEIAQKADVTKSLIHHHFRSKNDLWKEVKRRRLSEYGEIQKQLTAQGTIDVERFRTTMKTFFRFLQTNPEYVRLNAWMSLEEPSLSEAVRPDLMIEGVERLYEAQRKGIFRSDVKAEHFVVFFLTLCTHWFMAKESYSRANLVDADPRLADETYLEDMIKVFFDGVLPR